MPTGDVNAAAGAVGNKGSKNEAPSTAAAPGRPKKVRKSEREKEKLKAVAGDHRHRKTEEEEDEELMQNLEGKDAESSTGIRFEKTPFYIKNGQMRDYQVSRHMVS